MAIGLLIFFIILMVIAIISNQIREKSSKTNGDLHQSRGENYGYHHSGVYSDSHDSGGHTGGREGSHSHSDGGGDDGGGGGDSGGG